MSVCDPIADALTKIRNAYRAGHTQVVVNHNRLTESIVKYWRMRISLTVIKSLKEIPPRRLKDVRFH